MSYWFHLWVEAPGIHREDQSHTWDSFLINLSMLQTVAMATNDLKEYHFLAIFHLFLPFLELASVKHFETRQSYENDLGQ